MHQNTWICYNSGWIPNCVVWEPTAHLRHKQVGCVRYRTRESKCGCKSLSIRANGLLSHPQATTPVLAPCNLSFRILKTMDTLELLGVPLLWLPSVWVHRGQCSDCLNLIFGGRASGSIFSSEMGSPTKRQGSFRLLWTGNVAQYHRFGPRGADPFCRRVERSSFTLITDQKYSPSKLCTFQCNFDVS